MTKTIMGLIAFITLSAIPVILTIVSVDDGTLSETSGYWIIIITIITILLITLQIINSESFDFTTYEVKHEVIRK